MIAWQRLMSGMEMTLQPPQPLDSYTLHCRLFAICFHSWSPLPLLTSLAVYVNWAPPVTPARLYAINTLLTGRCHTCKMLGSHHQFVWPILQLRSKEGHWQPLCLAKCMVHL